PLLETAGPLQIVELAIDPAASDFAQRDRLRTGGQVDAGSDPAMCGGNVGQRKRHLQSVSFGSAPPGCRKVQSADCIAAAAGRATAVGPVHTTLAPDWRCSRPDTSAASAAAVDCRLVSGGNGLLLRTKPAVE